MLWTVEGADETTGQERTITLEADTQAQAKRLAADQGLLVAGVHKADPPTADYRGPAMPVAAAPAAVPEYSGLQLGSICLRVIAGVYLAVGIVGFIVNGFSPNADKSAAAVGLAYLIGGAAAACIFFAFGSACQALRDIARNSFR